ncbi:acyltransferase [Uliginosibacterium sp. H3]|uniref:Acyltransferase n=1 Tax=Uliginosibacterium silvisoli TaxID=3114758 RepID=A0ABU6K8C5_9RHOO|nr:acyltransferase [Uliginosibacterium sp. H3]
MSQGATTHSRADKAGFNPAINGLRGLCALFIFAFHVFNSGIVEWPAEGGLMQVAPFLFSTLKFGVEMFFMISGFVIVGSLVRHGSLPRFYTDRFVRIFSLWAPLHLAICILGPFLGWRIFSDTSTSEWLVLSLTNLLLLPPLLPLQMTHPASWSLSYEWLFYIGAGLVWWRASQGYQRSACWLAIALFAACVIAMPRFLFFAPGVIVFLLRDSLPSLQRWLRYPTLSLLVFLLAWGSTDAGNASPFYDSAIWLQPKQWVCTLIAFLAALHCFACVTARRGHIVRLLETSSFQFLGTISFSFYLVSSMVMFAVKKVCLLLLVGSAPSLILAVFCVLSLLLSVLLSWATYTAFEQHFSAWMRRYLRRSGDSRPAPSSSAAVAITGRVKS